MAYHSKEEILKRRATVSEMYLKGHMQAEIAAVVGVTHQQVSLDLKRIRQDWRSSAVRDFDASKAIELAKIDQVEVEAWQGWRRTIGKHTVTRKESGSKGAGEGIEILDKTVQTSEKLAGDPRFLDIVMKCVQKRCEILGLNAAIEHKGAFTLEDLLHASRRDSVPDAPTQTIQ